MAKLLRQLGRWSILPILGIVAATALQTAEGQSQSRYRGPRTPDGKPNLNGIWQSFTTAAWDLEDHNAAKGVPAGLGIVDDGEIPYRSDALAKKREHAEKGLALDPIAKCYLPGVPRAMYMPYPFEITQTSRMLAMSFEYVHASRLIYTDGSTHPEGLLDFWMGDSRGRWEGDTLIVEVTNFNDQTWFDLAGNYHSDGLKVVERYVPTGADHILYDATIEDPKVFTRPWKISFPLYRRLERNVRVLDYECFEFEQPFLPWHESPAPGIPGAPKK